MIAFNGTISLSNNSCQVAYVYVHLSCPTRLHPRTHPRTPPRPHRNRAQRLYHVRLAYLIVGYIKLY